MQNIIYDEQTKHSRLMVGYDRRGLYIREWSGEVPDGEKGFTVTENFFTWEQYRERTYRSCGDDGSGKLKVRLVAGAISLLTQWGGSSDDSGVVPSLRHYLNGHHLFTC